MRLIHSEGHIHETGRGFDVYETAITVVHI